MKASVQICSDCLPCEEIRVSSLGTLRLARVLRLVRLMRTMQGFDALTLRCILEGACSQDFSEGIPVDLVSVLKVHHDNCYVWELGRLILVVHVPLRQRAQQTQHGQSLAVLPRFQAPPARSDDDCFLLDPDSRWLLSRCRCACILSSLAV